MAPTWVGGELYDITNTMNISSDQATIQEPRVTNALPPEGAPPVPLHVETPVFCSPVADISITPTGATATPAQENAAAPATVRKGFSAIKGWVLDVARDTCTIYWVINSRNDGLNGHFRGIMPE